MIITHHKDGVITTLMDDKTAYELADELGENRKQIWYDLNHDICLSMDNTMNNSANMLRSLAAQLEESRAANHRLTELITLQREHIEELRQEIYKLGEQ
jgi:hypothetical protein